LIAPLPIRLRALLAVSVVAASLATLAAAAPKQAFGTTYSCNPCGSTSGPNETIDEASGRDYTYNIVYVHAWKYNGGSNYNLEAWTYSETTYHVRLCLGSNKFNGHGDTTAGGLSANLWGNEADKNNCTIEY
jgi:hypothetical protein